MKVLVVGPDRKDPGGVANYYNAVFHRLSGGDISAHYLEIGSTHGKNSFIHFVFDQVRFWRKLCSLQPDVVHLNPSLLLKSFLRDGLFILLAKMHRRRVLVFFRGWQKEFEKTVSVYLKPFFYITYRRADAFVVLADEFSTRLREWGIKAQIYMATTAVANELLVNFSIDRKIDDIEKTGVVKILFMARLERVKGILELIEAVELLLRNGIQVSLTIAGDGSIMEEVSRMVSSLGSHQNAVNIVGYVRTDEKVKILETHHLFCFPTGEAEGMPNAVLEAMAFGTPVITCPVGGLVDFFEDGVMGVLLHTREPAEIADGISSLLSSRSQMVAMARYNYQYAQQHFLASSAAEILRSRYLDMLDADRDGT